MFSDHRQQLKYLRAWSRFESYIRISQSTAYIALSDIERQRFFDAHFGWNWVTEQLRRELEQVSDLAVFREFDVKNRMENIKLWRTLLLALRMQHRTLANYCDYSTILIGQKTNLSRYSCRLGIF
jgi:hypothetical protein